MPNAKHMIVGLVLKTVYATVKPAVKSPLPPQVPALLATLRADQVKFGNAWSDMAIRNLMADMVRTLTSLIALLDGANQAACETARNTIERVMNGHSPRRGRYNAVCCFGYRVKTAGDAFAGELDDWTDMNTRADDMIAAIRNAYALASNNGNHNTNPQMLKVFMAPEFFFRGRMGAYDHRIVGGQEQRETASGNRIPAKPGLMELLRREIDNPQYGDWLFVLGSVIAATKLSTTVCNICGGAVQFDPDPARAGKTKGVCTTDATHVGTSERVDGAMVDNVSIVVKEKTTYTFTKELVSHIDYLTDTSGTNKVRDRVKVRDEWLDVFKAPREVGSHYNAASNVAPKFTDERMGGSIFTCDGISFGLEVCLDHAATKTSNTSGRLDNAANVQVQLIPSAGMSIGSISTVNGGVVFNVDGATPHVQAIGGGTIDPTVRYDLVYGGTEYEKEFPMAPGVRFTDLPSVGDLVGQVNLGLWDDPAPAPKVAMGGGTGSVLMYGPYPLP